MNSGTRAVPLRVPAPLFAAGVIAGITGIANLAYAVIWAQGQIIAVDGVTPVSVLVAFRTAALASLVIGAGGLFAASGLGRHWTRIACAGALALMVTEVVTVMFFLPTNFEIWALSPLEQSVLTLDALACLLVLALVDLPQSSAAAFEVRTKFRELDFMLHSGMMVAREYERAQLALLNHLTPASVGYRVAADGHAYTANGAYRWEEDEWVLAGQPAPAGGPVRATSDAPVEP